MKNTQFHNNVAFRVVAPILSGILFYMLVLMFFDSVESLADNFFSRELLFVTGLSLVFYEINRLIIVLLNIVYPVNRSFRIRVVTQYIVSLIVTAVIISLCLNLYFTYIEGFNTIQTELITFNSIFLFAAIFYHLYFFSLQFLYMKNESQVQKEINKKENVQYELNVFKNQINPGFLFQALEAIISELNKDKKVADDLVDKLAKTYRYILDNEKQELVTIDDEIRTLNLVYPIYQKIHFDAIKINLPKKLSNHYYIVPGTLLILLEYAINTSIISTALPIVIDIKQRDILLKFSFHNHQRIEKHERKNNRLELLKKAYEYYSENGISNKVNDETIMFQIPLLEIEEE